MFTGSIVALVTPMDEKGNVCRSSMKKLIDYHVANGTSAIVSVGTTGESATLSHDEHGDVVMLTLELADGRIPHQTAPPTAPRSPPRSAAARTAPPSSRPAGGGNAARIQTTGCGCGPVLAPAWRLIRPDAASSIIASYLYLMAGLMAA